MSYKKRKLLSLFSLIVLGTNSTLPVFATTLDLTEKSTTEKNVDLETTDSSNAIDSDESEGNSMVTTEETISSSDTPHSQETTEETTAQESSDSNSESEVEETSESTSEDTTEATETTETTETTTTTESASNSETISSSHSQQTSETQ